MSEVIRFSVNGKPVVLETDGSRKLLWVLRTDLELTGAKYGCGEGLCGACTVIVDRGAVRSCQTSLASVQGKEVTTIEGLASGGWLHPLQEAFAEVGALQCGYCTPGMIMNAYGLLLSNPRPTREEILQGMQPNLCRCGSHTRVLRAIQTAAGETGGGHD